MDESRVFRQPHPVGYDGAYYWLISQDPWLQRDTQRYLDNPRLRYRRILVPLLGHYLWYPAVILAFLFAFAWASATFCQRNGWTTWFALIPLSMPVVITSLDRMTVDIALAALLALWILRPSRSLTLWAILAAAALVRETGLLLAAVEIGLALHARKPKQALLAFSAMLPALGWFLWVHSRLPGVPGDALNMIGWIPLAGPLQAMQIGVAYPAAFWRTAIIALDKLALAGAVAAILLVPRYARTAASQPLAAALWLYALQAVFVANPEVWLEPFGYGRTMAPLWFLLWAAAMSNRGTATLLVLLLPMTVRTWLQLTTQAAGVMKWLFSHQ